MRIKFDDVREEDIDPLIQCQTPTNNQEGMHPSKFELHRHKHEFGLFGNNIKIDKPTMEEVAIGPY